MSNRSDIEAIKSRVNLVDIAKRYVELRRAGGRWVAPCPFHNETKPSFSINEEEGLFYCFGCQASGDLIDFYCRINGLEFREGLAQLAEEAGVELSRVKRDPQAAKKDDFKRQALKLHELALTRFLSNLKGKEGWVLGTSLTSGRLVHQMPCLLVAYPHTVAILYLIDCLNECVLRR